MVRGGVNASKTLVNKRLRMLDAALQLGRSDGSSCKHANVTAGEEVWERLNPAVDLPGGLKVRN